MAKRASVTEIDKGHAHKPVAKLWERILNKENSILQLVSFVLGQFILIRAFSLGGSRGSHCEENTDRSGTRYGSHAATPGDSTPSAPQPRSQRPHDRMDAVANNVGVTFFPVKVAAPSECENVPITHTLRISVSSVADCHERRVSMRLRAGQGAPNASTSDLSNSKQAK